jgi:hypothetical protein
MLRVKISLVVYGDNSEVPDLSDKEATLIATWYRLMMDYIPVKDFQINHMHDCFYELSWSPSIIIDYKSICEPDIYGDFPLVIEGEPYLVHITPI